MRKNCPYTYNGLNYEAVNFVVSGGPTPSRQLGPQFCSGHLLLCLLWLCSSASQLVLTSYCYGVPAYVGPQYGCPQLVTASHVEKRIHLFFESKIERYCFKYYCKHNKSKQHSVIFQFILEQLHSAMTKRRRRTNNSRSLAEQATSAPPRPVT